MKNSELIEHLQKFPAESPVCMLVIDREYRQIRPIATVHLRSDRGRPLLVIEIDDYAPLDETVL
jgi:hypothetical protein